MLLQRESDAFATAQALSDQHTSIVLQLMLASINRVKTLVVSGENVEDMVSLKELLNKHLLSLLVRFQDSERHVFVLVSMVEFCDSTKSSKILQAHTKFFVDAFARYRSEGLLAKLATAMRHWREACSGDKSLSHIVDAALGSTISTLVDYIVSCVDLIKEERDYGNNLSSKRKGRLSSEKVYYLSI